MRAIRRAWGRWVDSDWVARAWLLRASWLLLRANARLRVRGVQTILDDFASPAPSPRRGMPRERRKFDADRAAWAIEAASRHVPWRSDCLIKAIALTRWLRRHGYEPRFHLGMSHGDVAALEAHAWLTLDGRVIVGGDADSLERYSEFGLRPRANPGPVDRGKE